MKFVRPVDRKTHHINDSVGTKLLTRLRLSFSHLCCIEPETAKHFFLRCPFYSEGRTILVSEVNLANLLLHEISVARRSTLH